MTKKNSSKLLTIGNNKTVNANKIKKDIQGWKKYFSRGLTL